MSDPPRESAPEGRVCPDSESQFWGFFGIAAAFVLPAVFTYKTLLFFFLLSTSATELPGLEIPGPRFDWIQSFLPEDLGALGALNHNEQEQLKRWNDFLEELREDQDVASLTEAEIQIGAIRLAPQPPAVQNDRLKESRVASHTTNHAISRRVPLAFLEPAKSEIASSANTIENRKARNFEA